MLLVATVLAADLTFVVAGDAEARGCACAAPVALVWLAPLLVMRRKG